MRNRRIRLGPNLNALLLTLALCCLPRLEARAEGMPDALRSVIEVGIDIVLVRPLSAVSLFAGVALYAPAVGLSFMDGQSALDEAKEIFVTIPYEYVFERELGDF